MTAPRSFGDMKALLEALRDGKATPEQHRALEALLRDDAGARRDYVRYQWLCADLQALLGTPDARPLATELTGGESRLDPPVPIAGSLSPSYARSAWWMRAAALVLLGLVFGVLLVSRRAGTGSVALPQQDSGVATLVAAMDAQWGGGTHFVTGSSLAAMPLELTRGLAEIRFRSGAAVILQGPAECVLESPSHLTLRRGRISAKVPTAAIGFTVRTDQATVVDLGTEFGVSSEARGATDVHVFRGQVALGTSFGPDADRQLLGEGVAKRVEVDGSRIETIRSDELAFVRPKEFEARVKALHHSPYHRWLVSSYRLRREPALVLYYTWDSAVDPLQRVINQAGATAGKQDGSLGNGEDPDTAPQWVAPGRWPEQRALRFDASRGQVVRVPHSNTLNITQALTIAAWIRPNTALLPSTAVLASKRSACEASSPPNYELALLREPGTRGDVRCALAFRSGPHRVTSAALPIVPGQWMHVAVAANGAKTLLYVNGQRVATGAGPDFFPNEGDLWIGSPPPDPHAAHPHERESFEGLISEFMLVRRLMSEKEIEEMWSTGKPEP